MKECYRIYERLKNAEWRNPITDGDFVFEKYRIVVPDKEESTTLQEYIRKIVKVVEEKQDKLLFEEWTDSMMNARIVKK